jgi:hypothetical protein
VAGASACVACPEGSYRGTTDDECKHCPDGRDPSGDQSGCVSTNTDIIVAAITAVGGIVAAAVGAWTCKKRSDAKKASQRVPGNSDNGNDKSAPAAGAGEARLVGSRRGVESSADSSAVL